jgi:glycine/D-amino acid oxidase-like deaminating enzyme
LQKFGTINAAGCVSGPAGALWPYKLVGSVTTHISKTEIYPNLTIETHTPVEDVSTTNHIDYPFMLKTSRGQIKATHVIHCTNGYAAHLLPGLRGKLYPMRGQMTRQAVPPAFPRLGDRRSWILHYDVGYDYVTQSPSSTGDIYIGGGLYKALLSGQVSIEDADVGSTDDNQQNPAALALLENSIEERLQHGNGSYIVDAWTGIMGFTLDSTPIVGKIPYEISERKPAVSNHGREWIAAGFNGSGMVNCWLTGKAIAYMLLKGEDSVKEWFPLDEYACSPKRLQNTTLADKLLAFAKEFAV